MSALARAFDTARSSRRRVVLPETDDPRIAEAAARLSAEGLAEVVPLAAARPAPGRWVVGFARSAWQDGVTY